MPPENSTAPAAAPSQQITMQTTPGDGDGDMFDAANYAEFQQSVANRVREKNAQARAKKIEAKTETTTQLPAVEKPPLDESESLRPPSEAQEQDELVETLETEDKPTEEAPDRALEAQQVADAEFLGKVKQWMTGQGEMPAEFAQVPITLPNGNVEPFEEVVKGYMRLDDHTRGWQEATAKVQAAENALGAYKQHFDRIDNSPPVEGGKALHEIYTRNGNRKALIEAAKILAHEEQQDIDSATGTMIAVMRRLGIQDPNHHDARTAYEQALVERERMRDLADADRNKAWKIQQLEQAQQQRRVDESATETRKNLDKQLDQLRPLAFKQLGILHDDENKQIFWNKLGARVNQLIARGETVTQVTPAIVMDAARMTRDHIDDERKRRGQKPPPKPQPKTLQPKLGAHTGKLAKATTEDLGDDDAFARKFGLRRA